MAHRLSGPRRRKLVEELLAISPRCRWCSCVLDGETATLDHIVTVANGGSNHRSNQVLACEPCNRERGPMLYEDFERKKFPPQNVLKISHDAFEKVGTSIDEFDLEIYRLELGPRVSGAMLKENAKPLRERLRSSIRSRFKVIEKIKSDKPYRFYTEANKAEHSFYTYDAKQRGTARRRFYRTWGDEPFNDIV